jgi:hypothetical protein
MEIELRQVRELAIETKKFHTNIEQIELLKMDHAETTELNTRLDDLFSSYNCLCKSISNAQHDLDSLVEFIKLISDELRFIDELEDVELSRDWSQPDKFSSSDLMQHKLVRLILKLNEIFNCILIRLKMFRMWKCR